MHYKRDVLEKYPDAKVELISNNPPHYAVICGEHVLDVFPNTLQQLQKAAWRSAVYCMRYTSKKEPEVEISQSFLIRIRHVS